MAKADSVVAFTGSLGPLTAYRLPGVDKPVIRRKGGITKNAIKNKASFELTRRYNEEWKACIKAARHINQALYGVKHLADYNFSGNLNALCKHIQNDDNLSELGKRNIEVSKTGYKIEGFSLNKYTAFGNLLKAPVTATMHNSYVSVQLPHVLPGVNFFNPRKHPLYRFVLVLATVPDILYNALHNRFETPANYVFNQTTHHTPWYTQEQPVDAATYQLQLDNYQPTNNTCLVVCTGIEFGLPASNTVVQSIKYAGSAVILKTAVA
ncbi:MAG: hypothetical protein IPP48_07435 [Chitinophagaceae bacterium]|nr:hypothetical protein [Chitinophagaceae bacterium]